MEIGKYSLGIGDRFGHQGKAQLQAILNAAAVSFHHWALRNPQYSSLNIKPIAVFQHFFHIIAWFFTII